MSSEERKVDQALEKWFTYARKSYKRNDTNFIKTLKLNIGDFFKQEVSGLSLDEETELLELIQTCLINSDYLYDELRLPVPGAVPLETNSQPIPGYILLEPIGQGSFGEVWSALAPGMVKVTLKFLPRNTLVSSFNSQKELEALRIIKNINHVNLVPLSAIWEDARPDYIIYQMSISEQNLQDVLTRYQAEGKKGIPASQLIRYFYNIAEALDFLNFPESNSNRRAIMHCDVKPTNIFVTGANARLGDFGSATIFQSEESVFAINGTPQFLAPECFSGKLTPYSDQYSLAVCWYYLRTGQFPFSVMNSDKILSTQDALPLAEFEKNSDTSSKFSSDYDRIRDAHLNQNPNLSLLSLREQKAVSRALRKTPNQRFANSREFVCALERRPFWFPWVCLFVLMALLIGGYAHYTIQQKQAGDMLLKQEKEKLERQKQNEKEEFLSAANIVAVGTADQLVYFESLLKIAQRDLEGWNKFVQDCQDERKPIPVILEEYTRNCKLHVESVARAAKSNYQPDYKRYLRILGKHNIDTADIEVLYGGLSDDIYQNSFVFFATNLAKNAKDYALGNDDVRNMVDNVVKMEYKCIYIAAEEIAYGWLDLLATFPLEAQNKAFEHFKKYCPIIGKDLLLLGNLPRDFEKERNDLFDKVQKIMDEVEKKVPMSVEKSKISLDSGASVSLGSVSQDVENSPKGEENYPKIEETHSDTKTREELEKISKLKEQYDKVLESAPPSGSAPVF